MNWKAFTTLCVSAAAVFFPANGITCGPTEDPHDYFTSFFSSKAATGTEYRPFYYTALLQLYDEGEFWQSENNNAPAGNTAILREWADYVKTGSLQDAGSLVYFTTEKGLQALEESSRSRRPLPDSLAKNPLAQQLVKSKNTAAIRYLLFAGKTEAVSSEEAWEARRRDSQQVARYIAAATSAYASTTDAFLKSKYAFQRCKLAFYNNRYADCIEWYNETLASAPASEVKNMALAYKGGSLFRLGKKKEAAYAFSKAFAASNEKKRSNFIGFLWSTDYCNPNLVDSYTTLCQNNEEKATMLALFALHGTDYRLDLLKKVYALQPASPLLPLLATREIKKLEEQYFTPLLQNEKGGKALYVSWSDVTQRGGSNSNNGRQQAGETARFLETLFANPALAHRGFYGAGAAYLHYMTKDFEGAKALLAKAHAAAGTAKLQEQLQLIQLLIAASEQKTLDNEKEAALLPALKWLVQKAKTDSEYQLFCRNFFSQILAQQYEQQGNAARAALAYGVADLAFITRSENDYYYSYPPAIDFVREEMNTESLLKLYGVLTTPVTETEKFLVQQASIQRDDAIDVIGTSYMRSRDYAKAVEWFSRAKKLEPMRETQYNFQTGTEKTVAVDPFFDYLNDWQRLNKAAPVPFTKLTLAKKLLEMEAKIQSGAAVADKARLFYQYASALYNMSYYGNSWNAVAYHRSGSDWNEGTYQQPWQKEYYGVYAAKAYYQKAYEAATDKEFKAACLFMVAKCAQRQIPRPAYDFENNALYEKKETAFQQQFKQNPLFSKFKAEFGNTKFYQYAYNRCSYLRDYVKKAAPRR